jgi:twitching motility protein PilT
MAEIDKLIRLLVEADGSDLHLSTGRSPMIRKHGDMTPLDLPPMSNEALHDMLMEITPEDCQADFKTHFDTDFAYDMPDYVRMRVNLFQDLKGCGAVLRVIPAMVISAEQLGLGKGITDFCYLSKGLVVVTGPTGSGKSTTLAGMIDLINMTRPDHIITIEDPVEFVHQEKKCHITQREIRRHTKSFASALRAALRQDPDIIMVGEMRDLETIEIAIETAETGHLVFGTLHTSTAPSTVDRIIDAFPADRQNQIRTMLASSLKGVVSQTLLKRLSGGRVAAHEVLIVDRGISALIRDGKTFQIASAMQVGRAKGMTMLNDTLLALVTAGQVDPNEAYLKAVDKDDLKSKFGNAGITLNQEQA